MSLSLVCTPGTHLISAFLGQKALLINDHPECKAQHDSAVAAVPKHHREQEGEGNDSVGSCRRERSRSSALCKQKGLIKEAVYSSRPFLTGAALKGLLNSSPSHQAVRSSAELALPSQRMFSCMTCIFLAVLSFPSYLTIINTMCRQLHSVLQHKNVFEGYYHVSQPAQHQQSELIAPSHIGPHF